MQVLILGGGIAGVTCLETLVAYANDFTTDTHITLVSATSALRRAVPYGQRGRHIAAYRLEETCSDPWEALPWVDVLIGVVEQVRVAERCVYVRVGDGAPQGRHSAGDVLQLRFDYLCICMGAVPRIPKVVHQACASSRVLNERILTLRDTDSADRFRKLLQDLVARRQRRRGRPSEPRVMILGNGGIAMELAYVLPEVAHVDWVIRDAHIGHTFFDAALSNVLWSLPTARRPRRRQATAWLLAPTRPLAVESSSRRVLGAGLGPDWMQGGRRDQKQTVLEPAQIRVVHGHQHWDQTSSVPDADLPNTNSDAEQGSTKRLCLHQCCTVTSIAWDAPGSTTSDDAAVDASSQASLTDACLRVTLSDGGVVFTDVLLCATGVRGAAVPSYFDAEGQRLLRWVHLDPPLPFGTHCRRRCDGVDDANSASDPGEHGGSPGASGTVVAADTEDAEDTGIAVDEHLRTHARYIFAAGDCCVVQGASSLAGDETPRLWFQMRLWSQARMMGARAARSIVRDLLVSRPRTWARALKEQGPSEAGQPEAAVLAPPQPAPPASLSRDEVAQMEAAEPLDMELFCHVTEFCGIKVVLMGRYRLECAQSNNPEVQVLESLRPGEDGNPTSLQYIRVILCKNRLMGAVLLGETDLEEVYEHLLLNQLDVGFLGSALVDGSLDLADYFD